MIIMVIYGDFDAKTSGFCKESMSKMLVDIG